jgi:hypothetical protein
LLAGGAGERLALGLRAQHHWVQRMVYDYLNKPESRCGGEFRS